MEEDKYISKREALRKRYIETGDENALMEFITMNRRKKFIPIEQERRKQETSL